LGRWKAIPVDELPANLRTRFRELQKLCAVDVHERVELRRWTALRVGGPADLLIRCGDADAVHEVVDLLASHGVGWLVVGGGSRLVPPDAGVRVPVLNLTGELAKWEVDLDGCEAGAGAKLTQLRGPVARAGLSGLERRFGTAGSVGGTARRLLEGRAGRVGELVEWAEVVTAGRPTQRVERPRGDPPHAAALKGAARSVVVRVRFGLSADQPAAIRARSEDSEPRASSHWEGQASRVFEEVDGDRIDDLLERAGCGGMECGRARLPDPPTNTIVTGRRARAQDVIELCRRVLERVASRCGTTLKPSLCIVDGHGRRYSL
jgi:UDP-N-acetylmuramate dehydrogenase